MEPSVLVAVVSAAVGLAGVLFGIYKHFSTRKIARLVYEVSQISDYGVPASFLHNVPAAPVMVSVESVGNKNAENVALRIKTRSRITKYEIEPSDLHAKVSDQEVNVVIPHLNPTQNIRLVLDCEGLPADDQVEKFELSHSEGAGVNKRSAAFTNVTFSFLFSEFEFDLQTSTLKLRRFGPWRFQ